MNASPRQRRASRALPLLATACLAALPLVALASSHREAPLIAEDPQADNTDLYAFRSPDVPDTVTLIANYIPAELPDGGPNYDTFGENIRYEIHIDNDANIAGDSIVYRFTFSRSNQDPTTFFNIRLGQQNLKTTYLAERSIDGGQSFSTIVPSGTVPPPNIGPRSIENPLVGLGAANYDALITAAIATASTGERIYCGPADDPFFFDSGAFSDLADTPPQGYAPNAKNGLARFNVHTIAIQVPVATLQKGGLGVASASSILDPDFVIGVWASASRPATRTLEDNGAAPSDTGPWVQVSRVGMPFTNTFFIPMGQKDRWNALTPADETLDAAFTAALRTPELGAYMDDGATGAAFPALAPLRVPRMSLHTATPGSGFDFGTGEDGLYPLKGTAAVAGTALDDVLFGNVLLPGAGMSRSVDLWAMFQIGFPNLAPYQLATGKNGNPLAAGKPFVNNFLPTFGDMLRLNMAVPPTPRDSADFSSLGLVRAALLGITDVRFNASASLQAIPNMDGFPNGRRLEDDVARIELQSVAGVFLNVIGYWPDDYAGSPNPVTPRLTGLLGYTTGVEANDTAFKPAFPYVASPWRGTEVGQ